LLGEAGVREAAHDARKGLTQLLALLQARILVLFPGCRKPQQSRQYSKFRRIRNHLQPYGDG
jgi:hypothetical protein